MEHAFIPTLPPTSSASSAPSLPSRPFHILNEATKKKCFGRESTERVVLRHWKTKGICPVVQIIKVKLFMVLKLHKKTFFCTDATAIRSISFGRISEKRKHHTKSQTGHICQTLKWSECFVGQREASQIPDFLGYCFCFVPHVNCCCEREPRASSQCLLFPIPSLCLSTLPQMSPRPFKFSRRTSDCFFPKQDQNIFCSYTGLCQKVTTSLVFVSSWVFNRLLTWCVASLQS